MEAVKSLGIVLAVLYIILVLWMISVNGAGGLVAGALLLLLAAPWIILARIIRKRYNKSRNFNKK